MIITLDGPAASGKSTIGRIVADKLHFFYLYTGLFYRAAAYILTQSGKLENYAFDKAVLDAQVAADISLTDLVYTYSARNSNQGEQLFYKNTDITNYLQTPDIAHWASIISTHESVRRLLLHAIRTYGEHKNILADGRDCGTVIFPDAKFKFFLTASVDIRAERWLKDQATHGVQITHYQAVQHIESRDMRDKTRALSPLIPAPDAIIIDNSLLNIDQTVELMLKAVAQSEI